MKVTGIIAEYNPFHNGHKYHLQKAKELTGCDYTIVIMSGDYTQRGTPAIYSKYMRAKAALLSGADLVLEMPVFGTLASAPDFAECGVRSLEASGLCDFLFFGSESGSIQSLETQAERFEHEPEEISKKIKEGLKNGLSWPAARAKAYETYETNETNEANVINETHETSETFREQTDFPEHSIGSLPNDILGIEYIRAIHATNASILPVTMKRTDPGYHSEEKSGCFASATAARKAILEQNMDFLSEVLPDELFSALSDEPCPPITFDDCSLLLGEKLLRASLNELISIAGMPEELARKLYKNRLDFETSNNLVAARKDRNFTYARVNRCLTNLMLGITKEDIAAFKSCGSAPWLRILGFRKDAAPLLSELKQHANVPIITKIAAAESLLTEPAAGLFQKQLTTAELYRMLVELKSGKKMKNEFQRSVIIIP